MEITVKDEIGKYGIKYAPLDIIKATTCICGHQTSSHAESKVDNNLIIHGRCMAGHNPLGKPCKCRKYIHKSWYFMEKK